MKKATTMGASTTMEQGHATREWLDWLPRVRLLMIALILSVGVARPPSLPLAGSRGSFLPPVIFWIPLAPLHILLVCSLPQARGHRPPQRPRHAVLISALSS